MKLIWIALLQIKKRSIKRNCDWVINIGHKIIFLRLSFLYSLKMKINHLLSKEKTHNIMYVFINKPFFFSL